MLRCWSSLFRVAAVACAEPPNATPLIDMSNSSSEIIGANDFALVVCTARATTSRIATHGRSLQALCEFCERFLILAASMRKDGGTRSAACHQGRHLTARLLCDCGKRMPPAVAAQRLAIVSACRLQDGWRRRQARRRSRSEQTSQQPRTHGPLASSSKERACSLLSG